MMRALRHFATAVLAAAFLVPAGFGGVWAQGQTQERISPPAAPAGLRVGDFRTVAKFAIEYDDAVIGMVEGVALCDWGSATAIDPNPYEAARSAASQKPSGSQSCTIRLRNPQSRGLTSINVPVTLRALGKDGGAPPALSFALPISILPSAPATARPALPGRRVGSSDGESATVVIKNGDSEQRLAAPVQRNAMPGDRVIFELAPADNGGLVGGWRYFADPLTERGAGGAGPIGRFRLISAEAIKKFAATPPLGQVPQGGFLGLQSGGVRMRPMLPRAAEYTMLEDQTDYSGKNIRYPMAQDVAFKGRAADWAGPRGESAFRTLVLIGLDFPVDDKKILLPVQSETPGLIYEVLATGSGKRGSIANDAAQQIERAFAEQTLGMAPPQVEQYRKQEAVLIRARLPNNTEPGRQYLTWGTLRFGWELQYGDNSANIRFARIFNERDSEATSQLALPEAVVIEVQTGGAVPKSDTVPVMLGLRGAVYPMVAHRMPGRPTLYRTEPMTFVEEGKKPPSDQVGQVFMLRLGEQASAAIDRAQTHFLRGSMATAMGGEPLTTWKEALRSAWECVAKTDPQHPRLGFTDGTEAAAKILVETVEMRGANVSPDVAKDTIPIRLGDHAAMLLLRDAFVETMLEQLAEMRAIVRAEGMNSDLVAEYDHSLLDAWYRRMQPVITAAPKSPVAKVTVTAGGATGSFVDAYSVDFQEAQFRVRESVRGRERWLEWRHAVTRAALTFMRAEMQRSLEKVLAYKDCDRRELLKLTGHGFAGVSARLAPLFMKYRTLDMHTGGPMPDYDESRMLDRLEAKLGWKSVPLGPNPSNLLAEPDRIGRAYLGRLDEVAVAVANVEHFNDLADDFITGVVTTLLPVVAEVQWVRMGMTGIKAGTEAAAAVEAGGKAAGTVVGLVTGLPQYAYSSAFAVRQTYEQYEEVKFAYSTASILGVDRYFEAEAQKTPWWHTALSIFKDTVMQGVGIAQSVTPLRDGMKAWRGQALLKDQPIRLPTLRSMPPEAQQEMAVALLAERQAIERVGVVDAEGQKALQQFDNLAAEAAGKAPAPEPPPQVAAVVEQQANPIDRMVPDEPVPVDPQRKAKAQIARENLAGAANDEPVAGWVDEPTAVVDPDKTPLVPPPEPQAGFAAVPGAAMAGEAAQPAKVKPGANQPLPVPANVPPPNTSYSVTIPIDGVPTPVTFELGKRIGEPSTFFSVFELKEIPPILQKKGMIPEEMGEQLVIKILNSDPAYVAAVMQRSPDYSKGMFEQVIQRMLRAQERLKNGKIEQMLIVGWQEADVVLQKRLNPKAVNFRMFSGSMHAIREAFAEDPALGEALAKLWGDLRREKLMWLDGHPKNIYFRLDEESGHWICGVLDQDMLGTVSDFGNVTPFYAERMKGFSEWAPLKIASSRVPGYEGLGHDPREIMGKLLEQWEYLRFDSKTQQLRDGMISVEHARTYMKDLPFLPPENTVATPAVPSAAASQQAVPPPAAAAPLHEAAPRPPLNAAPENPAPPVAPAPGPKTKLLEDGMLQGTPRGPRYANDNRLAQILPLRRAA